jgi:hypothetical protein
MPLLQALQPRRILPQKPWSEPPPAPDKCTADAELASITLAVKAAAKKDFLMALSLLTGLRSTFFGSYPVWPVSRPSKGRIVRSVIAQPPASGAEATLVDSVS